MGKAKRMKAARAAHERMLLALPAKLAVFYDSLPKVACTGQCHDCCGPINWGSNEAQLVELKTGKPAVLVQRDKELRCGYLNDEKRCEVYELRPLICRLFGLVEKMRCPFGCEPERWLTDEEARGLLQKMKVLVGGYLPIIADASVDPKIVEYLNKLAQLEREARIRERGETAERPAQTR